MKSILIKYWGYIILLVIIIGLIIGMWFKNNKIKKLQSENNISNVLLDSISVYKDKLGNLISEKQAFNVKFTTLKKSYDKLDKNSKELVDKINTLEKKNKLVDATIIHQEARIDSLLNINPIVDNIKSTLTFLDSTKYLQYNFQINTKLQSLLIQKLVLPNKLYISHSFIPNGVSVKVTNSNDVYFKTNDINSYIIPLDAQKSHLKTYITVGGIGISIGILGTLFLIK